MKSKSSLASPIATLLATLLVTATLTGCATNSPPGGPMAMDAGHTTGGMAMSDSEMKNMCDMHAKMMSANTFEERRATMAEHMNTMSPQMRQHHMEMMQMMREQMGGGMSTK